MNGCKQNDAIIVNIMCDYIKTKHRRLLRKHSPGRHPKKAYLKLYERLMLPIVDLRRLPESVFGKGITHRRRLVKPECRTKTCTQNRNPKRIGSNQTRISWTVSNTKLRQSPQVARELSASTAKNRKTGSNVVSAEDGMKPLAERGKPELECPQHLEAQTKTLRSAYVAIYKFLKDHKYLQAKLLMAYKDSKTKRSPFKFVINATPSGYKVKKITVPSSSAVTSEPSDSSQHQTAKNQEFEILVKSNTDGECNNRSMTGDSETGITSKNISENVSECAHRDERETLSDHYMKRSESTGDGQNREDLDQDACCDLWPTFSWKRGPPSANDSARLHKGTFKNGNQYQLKKGYDHHNRDGRSEDSAIISDIIDKVISVIVSTVESDSHGRFSSLLPKSKESILLEESFRSVAHIDTESLNTDNPSTGDKGMYLSSSLKQSNFSDEIGSSERFINNQNTLFNMDQQITSLSLENPISNEVNGHTTSNGMLTHHDQICDYHNQSCSTQKVHNNAPIDDEVESLMKEILDKVSSHSDPFNVSSLDCQNCKQHPDENERNHNDAESMSNERLKGISTSSGSPTSAEREILEHSKSERKISVNINHRPQADPSSGTKFEEGRENLHSKGDPLDEENNSSNLREMEVKETPVNSLKSFEQDPHSKLQCCCQSNRLEASEGNVASINATELRQHIPPGDGCSCTKELKHTLLCCGSSSQKEVMSTEYGRNTSVTAETCQGFTEERSPAGSLITNASEHRTLESINNSMQTQSGFSDRKCKQDGHLVGVNVNIDLIFGDEDNVTDAPNSKCEVKNDNTLKETSANGSFINCLYQPFVSIEGGDEREIPHYYKTYQPMLSTQKAYTEQKKIIKDKRALPPEQGLFHSIDEPPSSAQQHDSNKIYDRDTERLKLTTINSSLKDVGEVIDDVVFKVCENECHRSTSSLGDIQTDQCTRLNPNGETKSYHTSLINDVSTCALSSLVIDLAENKDGQVNFNLRKRNSKRNNASRVRKQCALPLGQRSRARSKTTHDLCQVQRAAAVCKPNGMHEVKPNTFERVEDSVEKGRISKKRKRYPRRNNVFYSSDLSSTTAADSTKKRKRNRKVFGNHRQITEPCKEGVCLSDGNDRVAKKLTKHDWLLEKIRTKTSNASREHGVNNEMSEKMKSKYIVKILHIRKRTGKARRKKKRLQRKKNTKHQSASRHQTPECLEDVDFIHHKDSNRTAQVLTKSSNEKTVDSYVAYESSNSKGQNDILSSSDDLPRVTDREIINRSVDAAVVVNPLDIGTPERTAVAVVRHTSAKIYTNSEDKPLDLSLKANNEKFLNVSLEASEPCSGSAEKCGGVKEDEENPLSTSYSCFKIPVPKEPKLCHLEFKLSADQTKTLSKTPETLLSLPKSEINTLGKPSGDSTKSSVTRNTLDTACPAYLKNTASSRQPCHTSVIPNGNCEDREFDADPSRVHSNNNIDSTVDQGRILFQSSIPAHRQRMPDGQAAYSNAKPTVPLPPYHYLIADSVIPLDTKGCLSHHFKRTDWTSCQTATPLPAWSHTRYLDCDPTLARATVDIQPAGSSSHYYGLSHLLNASNSQLVNQPGYCLPPLAEQVTTFHATPVDPFYQYGGARGLWTTSAFVTAILNKCDACSNSATFLCSVCKRASYCSLKCQFQAWNNHRRICVPSNHEIARFLE